MPPISNPASGRNTATARISRSEKILPYAETIYHRSSPGRMPENNPGGTKWATVPRQPPLNATAPRWRAAGGGNAATANRQTPPSHIPASGGRPKRQSLPTRSRRSGNGRGSPPPRGVCSRASITNAAPSVRTSRRGSVLAAASHKSSAAVSSDAAGSNTARYFTPGGTALRRPARRRRPPRPIFEQVGAVAGRKEGLPAVTLPVTSPGYCAIRCGTHALDTPWGIGRHTRAGSADSRTRTRHRRP